MSADGAPEGAGWGKRALFALPLLAILAFGALGLWGLQPGRDPDAVPTTLQGKPMPEFRLASLPGMPGDGLSTRELKGHDRPVIVNVFASWCAPCRAEHGLWMALAERGEVPIYGIAYKNAPDKARGWLQRLGNPYDEVAALPDSRAEVGIRLGISGVPETFVVAPDGTILYKHNGPITDTVYEREIKPRLFGAAG